MARSDPDETDRAREIVDAIEKLTARFDDEYWLEQDRKGEFPHAFYDAIAGDGWLGIAMPEEVGGSGLGIGEAAAMMQAVAASGGGFNAASAIHLPIFSMEPVQRFGTAEQRERMIPPVLAGEDRLCFAVTEPNTGLDTTRLKTRAERVDGGYRVNGEKIWITNAHVAGKVMLLARTTPLEDCEDRTQGLSLFYTDLDPEAVEMRLIPKIGRHAVGSNMLFLTDLFVPEENRIGEEGQGFRIILNGLNPERILIASEAVGLGRASLRKAADYAKERTVFGRAIGQNQGVAHPLAKCWAHLEAADLMAQKAARLFDAGEVCGLEANAAKYLAGEACFEACHTAISAMGGMGLAEEYHVERYMREAFIPRTVPVSAHMILNFIAEKALGLPKSY